MISLNSQNWFQMRSGLGKMKSETPKPAQITCHSRITATSSSQGDQRSSCLLFFMAAPQWATAAAPLAPAALPRIAPMWLRSSSTMSVNSLV